MRDSIKNRLKEFRHSAGLTQSEVANICELTVASVNRHENGNRLPDKEVLEKYAKLYGITALELFINFEEG